MAGNGGFLVLSGSFASRHGAARNGGEGGMFTADMVKCIGGEFVDITDSGLMPDRSRNRLWTFLCCCCPCLWNQFCGSFGSELGPCSLGEFWMEGGERHRGCVDLNPR